MNQPVAESAIVLSGLLLSAALLLIALRTRSVPGRWLALAGLVNAVANTVARAVGGDVDALVVFTVVHIVWAVLLSLTLIARTVRLPSGQTYSVSMLRIALFSWFPCFLVIILLQAALSQWANIGTEFDRIAMVYVLSGLLIVPVAISPSAWNGSRLRVFALFGIFLLAAIGGLSLIGVLGPYTLLTTGLVGGVSSGLLGYRSGSIEDPEWSTRLVIWWGSAATIIGSVALIGTVMFWVITSRLA